MEQKIIISFPGYADLEFPSRNSFRAWVDQELKFWEWLTEEDEGNSAMNDLREEIRDRLYNPLIEAQSDFEDIKKTQFIDISSKSYAMLPLHSETVFAKTVETEKHYNTGSALGMLAQRLGISLISGESNDCVEGRLKEAGTRSEEEIAEGEENLTQIRSQIGKAKEETHNYKLTKKLKNVIHPLEEKAKESLRSVFKLALVAVFWNIFFGVLLYLIHGIFTSENSKELFVFVERFSFYIAALTAYGWGMRWIGRILTDSWRDYTRVSERYSNLDIVLRDLDVSGPKILVRNSKEDLDLIRREIFDLNRPVDGVKSNVSGGPDPGFAEHLNQIKDIIDSASKLKKE